MAKLGDISDRLVTMTSSTKTFNIAGAHTGQVIIGDPDLRARFAARYQALGISPNAPGILMTTAAFSPEGAAWVDKLVTYLDGNRQIFEAGMNAIPGVSADLRADPGDPRAVASACMAAAGLVGVFEKTLHVRLAEPLCAHSRAEQEACRRCLDLCPTGAITPAGEHVAIDPMICAGCGACAAACPSGAISYEAPAATHVFAQISTAGQAWRKAGGGFSSLA